MRQRSCGKEFVDLTALRPELVFSAVAVASLLLATVYSAIVSFKPESAGAGLCCLFPQGTGRRTRITVSVLTLIAAGAAGVWVITSVRQASRPASRYLIPDGYVGWARVQYDVPGAPPLPMESGEYVLRFPPDSLLKTSSPERFGWAKDQFFYYSGDSRRPLSQTGAGGGGQIWGRINGERMTPGGKQQYEEFFVGSESQFRKAVNLNEAAPPAPAPSK